MIDRVTIVGMGALGIFFGDGFQRALGEENVTFLADKDRQTRYQQEKILCNGRPCDFNFSDGTDGHEAQLLIFAVKAPDLEDAMDLAAPCVTPDTVILSALNGVTTEELLEQRFGPEKVLYTVTQGMDAVREGYTLTYHSKGDVFVGLPEEDYFDRGEKLDEVEALFRRTDLPFTREQDILHRMWCKFMLNVGVNQVCMAYELDYGGVQVPGEARDVLIAAMDEARKVGACQGVLVTQKDRQAYLAVMDGLHPRGLPSMRQDGLAHRKTEVELFAGTVLALADRYGMKAPVNEMLYQKVKEMETNW